jgi:hypothetical protein
MLLRLQQGATQQRPREGAPLHSPAAGSLQVRIAVQLLLHPVGLLMQQVYCRFAVVATSKVTHAGAAGAQLARLLPM